MTETTTAAGGIRQWPMERLAPYLKNARTHSPEQVAEIAGSIESFGMVGAIIVKDGIIAKGHGTLSAIRSIYGAGKLLYPPPGAAGGAIPYEPGHVPVIDVQGWTEAQFRAFVLADNRIAENAGWDKALLALELEDLRGLGVDMKLYGFSAEELAAQRKYNSGEDSTPAPGIKAISALGDIWTLGQHRLICGDSTDPSTFQRLLAGATADLVWTDPPYNVDYHKGGPAAKPTAKAKKGKATETPAEPLPDGQTIKNDDLPDVDFYQLLYRAFSAMLAVTKPGGCIYIAHADSEGLNFRNAMKNAGWMQKQCLIWVKNSVVLGRQDYNWKHEPILYGWKPGAGHYFGQDFTMQTVIDDDVDINKLKLPELREIIKNFRNALPTSVLREDKPHRSELHPTMKPVALVQMMLKNSSRENEIVLDGFGGSGTTLIAATKIARRARLVELDPIFVDVIVRRWEEFTGEKAILEGTKQTYEEVKHARAQTHPNPPEAAGG